MTVSRDSDEYAEALLFIALAVVACVMPAQSDTWWQLRTGEEMWNARRIMLHDEFTHTVPGQYWPNHEWLTQLIFFGAYSLGGLPLLTALCAGAAIAAWLIVSRLAPGPSAQRLLLVGTAAALSTPSWSLRPQVLTLALFAATLWVLVRGRHVWILPPLFLVWANLHGAVAAGGVLVVVAVIAAASVDRAALPKLLAVAGLCLVATALTPLGFSLWLEIPESLARLKVYNIIEWRAPSLANPADYPFWVVAAGLAGLVVMKRGTLKSYEGLMLAGSTCLMFVLAVRSTRNSALFLLCAVPLAGTLLAAGAPRRTFDSAPRARRWFRRVTLSAAAIAAGFVAYAWSVPLPALGWRPFTGQMRAAIAGCEGPLYNRYDEGGFIIWFLKDRKVFIDSRQDPFPQELVLEQLRVEETGDYSETFDRYGIRCALTPAGSRLSRRLQLDGWLEFSAGPAWSVFGRPDPSRTAG